MAASGKNQQLDVEEEATKVVGDSGDRRHAATNFAQKIPAQKVDVDFDEESTKVGEKRSDRRHAACWRLALER